MRAPGPVLLAIALAAWGGGCAPPGPGRAAEPPPRPEAAARPRRPGAAGPRYFLGAAPGAFWVERGPGGEERLVFGGARIEAREGLVVSTAYESGDEGGGRPDALRSALAVPASLGGGYVHLGEERVFFSRTFQGPLEEIPLDPPRGIPLRGARAGPRSVWIFGRGVSYVLDFSASPRVARAEPTPGLVDRLPLPGGAGLELDALGRVRWVPAAGSPALPLLPARTGTFARGLSLESARPRVHAPSGFFALDGALDPEGPFYGPHLSGREFFSGVARARGADGPGSPAFSALQEALVAGAPGPEGEAYGALGRGIARVDLASGETLSESSDGALARLACLASGTPTGPLFACESTGPGPASLHVLTLEPGGAGKVRLDRTFPEEGYFVASDDGAFGFVGPCAESEDAGDGGDPAAAAPRDEAPAIAGSLCVRTRTGSWVSRRAPLDPGEEMVGWAPRLDGTAVALVRIEAGGVASRSSEPAREAGGVRVLRVRDAFPGLTFARPSRGGHRYGLSRLVLDRSFRARDDGGVDGWLEAGGGPYAGPLVRIGVGIDRQGRARRRALPEGIVGQVASGDFGIAVHAEGALFETRDHGRTWRPAGRWPLPPGPLRGGCSRLGCAVEGLARVGWGAEGQGAPAATVAEMEGPRGGPAPSGRVRLSCALAGKPRLLPRPGAEGASITNFRVRAPGGPAFPEPLLVETRIPRAGPGLGDPASSAPKRALLWRRPFTWGEPLGRVELDTFELDGNEGRVVPLLGEGEETALLLVGRSASSARPGVAGSVAHGPALVLRASGSARLVLHEPPHRPMGSAVGASSGLLEGPRLVALGEIPQRLTIEEAGGPRPSVTAQIGAPLDPDATFALTLGKRDGGGVGLVVLDAPPFASPGVAVYDPTSASVADFEPLAPFSTLGAGGPGCAPERGDVVALVTLDPSAVFELDEAELPRVALGRSALVRLRWGRRRVCLEALDARIVDHRAGGGRFSGGDAHLALRLEAGALRGGLVGGALGQPLSCRLSGRQAGEP